MSSYRPAFDSKLPNIKTTIFSIMSKLAYEQKAYNLSQGYPDFPVDPELIDLVSDAMKKGYNQYAPMPGIYELREAIAKKAHVLYGREYDIETEVTVTAGATQAIFTAITAFVRPGDEVLLFKPSYDCYEPAVEVNGGVMKYSMLQSPNYTIDWEDVEDKLSPKTRMVIINTPHNPTGSVLSESDMCGLEKKLKDTDTLLLSDEVYEHIVFDGLMHQSAARFPHLAERAFICASFGKTFHTTGWKTGYCLAPEELMWEFRKTHQFNVFSANHPMQRAFAVYLENALNYTQLPELYQYKRDHFLSRMRDSRFSFVPSKGTYFQLMDYSVISDEGDIDFAKRLCIEHKVASIPVSIFTLDHRDDKLLRFCFAKKEVTLEQAAEILCTL